MSQYNDMHSTQSAVQVYLHHCSVHCTESTGCSNESATHTVSVATSQVCHWNAKADIDDMEVNMNMDVFQ